MEQGSVFYLQWKQIAKSVELANGRFDLDILKILTRSTATKHHHLLIRAICFKCIIGMNFNITNLSMQKCDFLYRCNCQISDLSSQPASFLTLFSFQFSDFFFFCVCSHT